LDATRHHEASEKNSQVAALPPAFKPFSIASEFIKIENSNQVPNSTFKPCARSRAKNSLGSKICSGIQAPGLTSPLINDRATPAAPAAAALACPIPTNVAFRERVPRLTSTRKAKRATLLAR
jgi:hypothetical protein